MCEQSAPDSLVRDAVRAEQAGFDFELISDHYFPWLDAQGHSPNAWPVLGAGENLNEHVIARGWPPVNLRHEMLSEAVDIIRALFGGDYVNYVGSHFRVDSAKLWDLPDPPPRIALAASGTRSGELAAHIADADRRGTVRRLGRHVRCCRREGQAAHRPSAHQLRPRP